MKESNDICCSIFANSFHDAVIRIKLWNHHNDEHAPSNQVESSLHYEFPIHKIVACFASKIMHSVWTSGMKESTEGEMEIDFSQNVEQGSDEENVEALFGAIQQAVIFHRGFIQSMYRLMMFPSVCFMIDLDEIQKTLESEATNRLGEEKAKKLLAKHVYEEIDIALMLFDWSFEYQHTILRKSCEDYISTQIKMGEDEVALKCLSMIDDNFAFLDKRALLDLIMLDSRGTPINFCGMLSSAHSKLLPYFYRFNSDIVKQILERLTSGYDQLFACVAWVTGIAPTPNAFFSQHKSDVFKLRKEIFEKELLDLVNLAVQKDRDASELLNGVEWLRTCPRLMFMFSVRSIPRNGF